MNGSNPWPHAKSSADAVPIPHHAYENPNEGILYRIPEGQRLVLIYNYILVWTSARFLQFVHEAVFLPQLKPKMQYVPLKSLMCDV